MNRTQFINALVDDMNERDSAWDRKDAHQFLEAYERIVTDECCKGGNVTLSGFCKFARVDRKARQGRNPMTGETIQIAAKSVAKITPLKGFKDAVLASVPKKEKKDKSSKKKSKK